MNSQALSHFENLLVNPSQFGGLKISDFSVQSFVRYYKLVLKWNDQLHLTTLIDPKLFAQRHIFESLFAEGRMVKSVSRVWDLGSGLGVPGIPLAIYRPELSVILVEARKKKATFLKEVISDLQLRNVEVFHIRLELIDGISSESVVTARAVERMKEILPDILEVGKNCGQFLIFGGLEIESLLISLSPPWRKVESFLIPYSNSRFLFSLPCFT